MARDTLELMDAWGPEKVVCVSDRRTGMRGVLVIDNTARGMGKGGTRMSPDLDVEEVARLARTMTWKWAACDLFHGGAKAGILGDPTAPGKEGVLRAFARALANEVPGEYVFGLDMGLSEEDAAVFVDELRDRGVAVGLPASLGGLPYDRLGLTGFGVAEAVDAAARELDLPLHGARVTVQGFGAVGQAVAERLVALGAVVVAVSTARGSVTDPDGLDIARLVAARDAYGEDCVLHCGGGTDTETALTADCDIMVPAAREDLIGEEVATRTTARLVVEAANLPTTPAAKRVLFERGVMVVPDFIANAGGIVAAAHSMEARRSPFTVDPGTVREMISERMRANTAQVVRESLTRALAPHDTARALAEERVRAAMRARGQCPDR
ncbi:Glu/Leu/Phe/Val dehydrogenase dimerization domain-containing protein [Sphaerisporangium sp. NPDC051017]|uniref:Glu/Leu/Phe/Val family dehydrogenase n=1 Tax=Sphaerisporangium sp. NPDC051017 TaxID=3154636 RepID=UPI00342FE18B